MKMIVAIVQDKDSNDLNSALVKKNIRSTRLASTGGFLKAGNTTFLIGSEDEDVDKILDIINESSHTRNQFMTPPLTIASDNTFQTPIEVQVGGATVFVLPVDSFHRF